LLEPLTDADAGRVVEALLGGTGIDRGLQRRIVEAAAGNPLFVEQLLSMLIDNGSLRLDEGRWITVGDLATLTVPPTIQALLAARLDLLDGDERAVIEPASVIGQSFAVLAVTALVMPGQAPGVQDRLVALTGKQLVQPNPDAADDDGMYRFHHVMVRDAAYRGLLKRDRATLHERFVEWAEPINVAQGRVTEFEEIQGYHLEQAYRYLVELGTVDKHARSLGERAAAKLASAGRRAFARGDLHAAVSLLRRASGVLPAGSVEQLRLLPDLGEALMESGELEQAQQLLVDAQAAAESEGEASLAAQAELVKLLVGQYTAEDDWSTRVMAAVHRAIPVFEREANHAGLALASRLQFGVHGTAYRWGEAALVAQQVVSEARLIDDSRLERRGASAYAIAAFLGPTRVDEAVRQLEVAAEGVHGDRRTEGVLHTYLAVLYAMQGDIRKARSEYAAGRTMLEEVGAGLWAAASAMEIGQVEVLAGRPKAAEAILRRDLATLQRLGETFISQSLAGLLARVLYEQDRIDDADQVAARIEAEADPDDVDAQARWRAIRGKVAARRGDVARGRALVEEAVALRRSSDALAHSADALRDLAEVQRLAGDADWEATLAQALALFTEKGDIASVARLSEMSARRSRGLRRQTGDVRE
jgi:predicted ATPase